ncbi:SH3 domain-containing protein [Flammeovirga agarivorans]|uniref:SH3 domain-containing protein n=1 Tax=Flammeovirga agarivorans TaxID=2726742 RepID=A0A7X8XXF1_9BACT|nr:SH3 domain-containing protein [Flammeovirga agarivorans]NLR93184.1 SH3 domain-containing protein [Flammeovirga agarivorans]
MRLILSLISLYILIFSQLLFAETSVNSKIEEADNLFSEKQYIEAFKIYNDILEKDRTFSSRMLLRMAFIQEGQGNYSSALYFLNLQYRLTADRQTLNKMSKIAEEHNLLGYQYSDKEFFVSMFNNMQGVFAAGLIILLTACLALMYIRKRQDHSITTLTFFVVIFSVIGLWAFNGGIHRELGIVKGSGAILMDEPSAGGKKLVDLSAGERFQIKGESDIWYKIELPNESEGYIRKGRVFDIQ